MRTAGNTNHQIHPEDQPVLQGELDALRAHIDRLEATRRADVAAMRRKQATNTEAMRREWRREMDERLGEGSAPDSVGDGSQTRSPLPSTAQVLQAMHDRADAALAVHAPERLGEGGAPDGPGQGSHTRSPLSSTARMLQAMNDRADAALAVHAP
eukprot:CAMPEP_0194270702 /NCGR_PEP_ID=MMETSP0169-20130528/4636_1 /TAXON_ID=218684 /ORGANISM="Corethron pennatum, Strain L29A3" /LENGTH=154 /DNA_ID=CAMNT_0039012835 /DNA_START=195 /DNA_END=656 /DNA_ORIENTATION=-